MSKTPMVFNKLIIEKRWSDEEFKAKASFSSQHADVTISVSEKDIQAILELCADKLMETANDMSDVIRGDIIEALPVEQKRKRIK